MVVKNGASTGVKRGQLKNIFKGKAIDITVDLKMGKEITEVWTCDLTDEYIRINSEYAT